MAERVGLGMLDEMAEVWDVKPGDVQPFESGFHWWPGHHKVTVRCEPKKAADDPDAWRLSVTTEYLKGLNVADPEALTQVFGMGAYSPSYAWVCTPPEVTRQYKLTADGAVSFYSSTYVKPATVGWLPRFFAQMAIMQPIDAQRSADSFGEMLKGTANKSGTRLNPVSAPFDAILNVARDVLAPQGQQPSRWSGSAEFAGIVEQLGRGEASAGKTLANGVALETPFGAESAFIALRHDIAHPALGAGLLASIRLPVLQSQAESAVTCLWLNYTASTSWTEVPVHATWHPQEFGAGRFCPAYGAFVPNALYSDGLATNLALWNMGLARWARRSLWPQLEDKPMREILDARWMSAGV